MKTVITNGTVLTPFRTIQNGSVVIEAGKIIGIQAGKAEVPDAGVIDAGGQYIAPGFIDLHVHGGGGHDFMDGTEEAFLSIARTHARYGTTAMVPTTLTAEKEDLLHTLDVYERAHRQNTDGAAFLGMHLEGPYFALSQRGAQDPRYIRNPDPAEYEEILDHSPSIARWSAAPELPGAIPFGRRLREKGILAAIAHTDAFYDDVVQAYETGYSLVTHLYSAMSGVTRKNAFRYAGVIESAYLLDLDVEIIGDGIHLPVPLLKLVYKLKGPDRTALITDAMRGAAMPEGESILGSLKNGLSVIIEDGVAKLPDRTSFAGSVATFDRLVRNMVTMAGVPLPDAVRMGSTTPARIMGVGGQKGALTVGRDADVILFDDNINVSLTMVGGRVVYQENTNALC
ncbi:N-acetylglucosamine-6-phosphate deacetylase [Arsenicibacter rosenii]|uniref:N-acetylglucosamine-6-phosphate deacetylase n=1 Tax=Arsenicibacter rosenii TaxID=1750698 RepID=A0A1S2VRI7_9BACT|nr:N-acetylglucosamine-6-phosphate deacetylase [Arsenicibacter rosenii]OIN60866.1 N-acetylglucosamine-6-phosphate deacetylase [Arsenicibacter rosenii]